MKNNVIMIIIVIVIIILLTIAIIIMIITHKDSELIYSICILYVRVPNAKKTKRKACPYNIYVEIANAKGEGCRERGNLRHSEAGKYLE